MKCLNKYYSSKLKQYINYEQLKQEYINGKSLRAIEVEYGISHASLSRHLKQDNITIMGNNYNQNIVFLLIIPSKMKN